jgi:DNA-binding transcriptional MerR regulator
MLDAPATGESRKSFRPNPPPRGDPIMSAMSGSLSIGEFSCATHMTIKTLRHYHQVGLLEPVEIDPRTGYRRYAIDQIPTAQVIRRFRDLEMPLEEIQAVLSAPDLHSRNQRITAHLSHLERELGRTQSAVASLRELLAGPSSEDAPSAIELRTVPAVEAAAVTEVVDVEQSAAWLQGALGELRATLAVHGATTDAPGGGIYSDEVFTDHRGQVTIFIPCPTPIVPTGRVATRQIPAAELAVIEHCGPSADIDRAYGALATYVARHTIAIEGPIREYYLVDQHDTPDSRRWRTEVGWPIFRTSGD